MLNKESKTGTIKKIDVKHLALIGATIGILAVSIPALSKTIGNNTKIGSFDSDKYTSYSQQVESMYGVDIDDKTEAIINSLSKRQELVEDYINATNNNERKQIFDEIKNDSLADDALTVVKQSVAKENGGSWEEYTISNTEPSYGPSNWVIRKDGENTIELDTKSSTLVQKVANLQSVYDTQNMDNYVDSYDQVIKATVKYVGKTSDKAK